MRLFFLVALTMCAFAANSILTRVGVAHYGMDAVSFAALRVAAGAVMLAALVMARGGAPFHGVLARWRGALALAVYMLGFSWAYLTLGAGLGALILLGSLQIMMFGWAVWRGQAIPRMRWVGAFFAMVGLVVLLWPTERFAVPIVVTLLMITATIGWATYTILGQGAKDPLLATTGNFILCLPIVALALLGGSMSAVSAGGVIAATLAGAVTSGLGYALWYRVLPQLPTTVAAVAQLSVPVIAVVGGVLFLSEELTMRMAVAGVLVLGGIALSNVRWAPKDRK